ncbi:DDE-type integrase/transposase/recombinase [Dactylosporangium sp. CA-139066]|uniref:DDE-type integrase/transposase/recombinase n=1 Tax=Dactylosporangium sp. CA-139066 TaxID=3239930 RepID=UPI003D8BA43F
MRHGLVDAQPRGRRRQDYTRWQRDRPMELWQMDIVGGIVLADGTEAKVITGVDDHSRYCVIATVVRRATGRAVCLAFVDALRRFGTREEVLTDNGKQFTGQFTKPRPGEVLFEKDLPGERHHCPQHQAPFADHDGQGGAVSQRELLDAVPVWPSVEAAQAAIDEFCREYNTHRPHQALGMAFPADRFAARSDQPGLPLRVPASLSTAPAPGTRTVGSIEHAGAVQATVAPPVVMSANGVDPVNLAVELASVVPASGNLGVCGQQFWLGPAYAGTTITLWADTTVVHLLKDDVRLKTVPSRLTAAHLRQLLADGGQPAGPSPLPAAPLRRDAAVEVDRLVNATGLIGLAGRRHPVGSQFASRRLTIRLDQALMQITDHGVLLRSLPNPLSPTDMSRIRDARSPGRTSPGTTARPATSRPQRPRRPGHRQAEGPCRHPVRRRYPGRRGRRHHLPHLRPGPTRRRGRPDHSEDDRPLQGPET